MREPEPCAELSISSADDHNPEDFSSEAVKQIDLPKTDSRVCGTLSRQKKPLRWVAI